MANEFVVTSEWIHAHSSRAGGWTAKQLALLGVAWPPQKGWIGTLVGKKIPDDIRTQFERVHELKSGSGSWMAALEAQFAALRCLDEGRFEATNPHPNSNHVTRNLMRSGLRRANCFSWSQEMWVAVSRAAKSLPGTSTISAASRPAAPGWFFLGPEHDPFDALLYTPIDGRDALLIALFRTNDGDIAPFLTFVWGFEESLDALNSASRRTLNSELLFASAYTARFLLCGWAWLQQKIVTLGDGHVERHRQKQLAREHDAAVSTVKVIQLRRTEHQQHPNSESSESVEWSCRWIVNGHWRNQPYANGEHKLIYILPYVKGPEDKPLKVPTHTVYAVNR